VEVVNSCRVDEVPVLVGNTTRLQLALLQGRVTVQVSWSVCIFCSVLQCLFVHDFTLH